MTHTATWPPASSTVIAEQVAEAAERQRQRLADPALHAYQRPVGEANGCRVCGCDRAWHTAPTDAPVATDIAGLPDAEAEAIRARVWGES